MANSNRWLDHPPFHGVLCDVKDNRAIFCQALPDRPTVIEAKADLRCILRTCNCHKLPGSTTCLREEISEPREARQIIDYIDNSLGFRAIPSKV